MIFVDNDHDDKRRSRATRPKPVKPVRSSTKAKAPNAEKKARKKTGKGKNLLDYVPVKECKWTRQKDRPDLVKILKPRFETKMGGRIGKKMKLKKTFNLNLDEYGTAVWRLCDGRLTVREVGDALKTQFGDEVEPLYFRLAEFLIILEGQKVIFLKYKPKPKKLKRI